MSKLTGLSNYKYANCNKICYSKDSPIDGINNLIVLPDLKPYVLAILLNKFKQIQDWHGWDLIFHSDL